MDDSPSSSRASKLTAESMARIGSRRHRRDLEAMAFQEAGDDQDDDGGLGGVAPVSAEF
ncbi:hypothetical protein H7J76_25255 [Mycolicibacterium fortuitum]|nr:hypothetical protein [Mycolicibacterium fortuitum]NOR02164.1 hypothetical protein [Mycolicibacterium fortuitum]